MCVCGGRGGESVNLIVDVRLSSLIHHTNVWGRRPVAAEAAPHLLVDGLEKLALVFPHLGVVDLLHQLRVFVDEPCFPEYIGGCVLYLRGDEQRLDVCNRCISISIRLNFSCCQATRTGSSVMEAKPWLVS